LDPPTPSIVNSFSFVMRMSPTSIIPSSLSINSSSPSSTKSPSFGICYGYTNMGANPP